MITDEKYKRTSSWNRILLEKITFTQLVTEFPEFMEREGSLPSSHLPSLDPVLREKNSSQHLHPLLRGCQHFGQVEQTERCDMLGG
jgi:hypothetical protein